MKKYDVAVIGGGLAGLIAAVELANSGKTVVVLDKSNRIGGRAITLKRQGALFNLGGHAIYKGGEAYAILEELGVKLEGGVPSVKGLAIWNHKLLPLPGDPVSLLSSSLLSWSGKIELGRLMLKLSKIQAAVIGNNSLREWAELEIHDPMVRHFFYALCRTATYNNEPDYQLAGSVLQQVQRSLKSGVVYLHGGWQTIVDQLRELAVRTGVTVLDKSPVTRIEHENGVVSKLCMAEGEALTVTQVIAAIPPGDTYKLIHGAERTALKQWRDQCRPAMAACLDLCLKRLPVADRHFAIGIDEPVFFTNHSRASKLSDNGTMVVHLIKYNGAGERDPKADEHTMEQTMNRLHPGWQEEVVVKQFLPNMTVVPDYMHNGRTDREPGPSVPEIKGLYVAGDWASHGEMLADAAAASARRAVRQLLQDADSGAKTTVDAGVRM
jgi:phytoene dehydrogenase-like protein